MHKKSSIFLSSPFLKKVHFLFKDTCQGRRERRFGGVFHRFHEFSLWKTPDLSPNRLDFHRLSHNLWKTRRTLSGKQTFDGEEWEIVINAQKQFANKQISTAENEKASTVYPPWWEYTHGL